MSRVNKGAKFRGSIEETVRLAMKKRKYLSKKEVQALIDASQQQDGSLRDYCMLLMCFIHGLRVSELRFFKSERY
ncbi:type 1 fimbriae regulatory protein FimB [Klebsiella michiganensis]|nr:type 1 fimbriae regulatory protein FimB [Klebsiella michiganensis]